MSRASVEKRPEKELESSKGEPVQGNTGVKGNVKKNPSLKLTFDLVLLPLRSEAG